ncbi:replication initiation factor domain-containing protein [Ruminiclostridium cellulolyticum]|uniref:Replication initiation factor n=1 Tax=Ruminiclostridium cellulolyticum (strain ATCC 35319 / DSM 5812 / JCM 6584 / H10) TaxID=394503 RepID=B8I2C5_RUMCH|nr:replication initiation factor domain-containing protein [Ruminiclostridium cellulolyticum]ACL75918.1 replication initiation factor [Ruminiclostridium cellulolyticum H10]ACL75929.1 replication initiation factor [Ruminiclostridium cellulolyticum H10]ACL75940.1 replication initiation factor [Ruminiclostridium cellulolyticum H10]
MKISVKNCMIDWLEFSVFEMTEKSVLYALGLEHFNFEVKKGRFYGRVLSFENIITISSQYFGNGGVEHVHVRFTGKGCRLLERIYGTTDLRSEIRLRFILSDVKVSRMDIALDYNYKFVVDYFESVLNERLTGVKVVEHIGSLKSGLTLYLGSRKSEKFFRLYEKDFEQNDFENYKDRLELVLKNQYATYELFNENELIKIVSTYMNDIEWQDTERQRLWNGMKNGECEISPKIRHKKSTLKEKGEYILTTYAKTLKAYAEQYGTKDISSAIHDAVLSEKEIRLINNEKVLKLMKYRKQARQKDKQVQESVNEIEIKKGILLDNLIANNQSDKFEQMRIC